MKTAVLLALFFFTAPFARTAPSANDLARYLAGLSVSDPALAERMREPVWVAYSEWMERKWTRMEERQLSRAREWMAGSQPNLHRTRSAIFYTFSGPDLIYPRTLFPRASTYILCGTEPVGHVPDISQMSSAAITSDLKNLSVSLNTMLRTHYFITKDMRVDLQRGQIGGTLPLLYVFLARTGCTIRGVNVTANSAQIDFTAPTGERQTAWYFKTDLSNGGSNAAFFYFCRQHGRGVSLVKAASYLMQGDGFSKVRNFLLTNSSAIIQDDSGIPLRAFDPKQWTLRLYGTYADTIELFKDRYQPDLAAAYRASNPAPLGFSFGYAWQREKGVLILATPR